MCNLYKWKHDQQNEADSDALDHPILHHFITRL